MRKKLYIGVDPDTSKSGIAFLTSEGEWSLHTSELYNVKELVLETADRLGVFLMDIDALVETPRIDSASFGDVGLWKAKRNQFRMQGFPVPAEKALRLVLKVANKKGRCSQIGEEILKLFKNMSLKVGQVKPSDRRRMDGFPMNKVDATEIRRLVNSSIPNRYPSKLDATRFKALTGIEGRTNEEKRDAGLLLIHRYVNLKL